MWRPEVTFILTLIAFFGLTAALNARGAILTSVVGTILLALALSKVAILAVNASGPLLTTLAVALFAIDLLALANGLLTGVGIAALLIDSLMLFDSSDPLLRLLRGYLIKGVILWAVSFMFGVIQGLRAQRLPVKVGTETMLGKTVNALTPIGTTRGKVFVEGEYWNATSKCVDPTRAIRRNYGGGRLDRKSEAASSLEFFRCR
jgi:membrane-bound serine protease (ClpP class)